ncbi:transferase [Syncephalis plumigaleata]|nr:transferase [Syncephalis plumigaleata]
MITNIKKIWITPGDTYTHETYQLSHADHITGAIYPHRLFFYKNHDRKLDFLPTDKLLNGLKTVLEHYPIMYGRLTLREDGEYEVRPSTEGVRFIEVLSDRDISTYEPNWAQSTIPNDLQAIEEPPSEEQPVLNVKVTRLANNSGVAICVSCHHYIADGFSCVSFIKNWCAIVRGESIIPPYHDRQFFRLDPKPNEAEQRQFWLEQRTKHQPDYKPETNAPLNKGVIVHFTMAKLKQLKADAMASLTEADKKNGWFSTMDVLIELLWRATDKPITLMSAVNMRGNYPDIPKNYFGNAINQTLATVTVSDLIDRPIGSIAMLQRQQVLDTRSHTMKQWLMQADITSKTTLVERVVNWAPYVDYAITDWSKFGYYTIDFGEGRPIRSARFVYQFKRVICLLDLPPAADGSQTGYDVAIAVEETSYKHFCNDKELLTYGTIIT